MIRLNHVSKIYGDGSKKAVDDLSWDIEDGKITGFIGPNGAGKTTTLKMITGILAPSEGTIEINGKDIQKDPLEAKRQFGFVPDDPDAFLRVRGIERSRRRPGIAGWSRYSHRCDSEKVEGKASATVFRKGFCG